MREDLSLRDFAEVLATYHSIHIPPACVKLLMSVDAASGHISFSQFQRALGQGGSEAGQAGKPIIFQDQAKSIIEDNSGRPDAPPRITGSGKFSTDISADSFVRRKVELDRTYVSGDFSSNPIEDTNFASVGNPLVERLRDPSGQSEELYGAREMANTATRMFLNAELDQLGYEQFLDRLGVQITEENGLKKLISTQQRSGSCTFQQFSKILQRELGRIDARGLKGSSLG